MHENPRDNIYEQILRRAASEMKNMSQKVRSERNEEGGGKISQKSVDIFVVEPPS